MSDKLEITLSVIGQGLDVFGQAGAATDSLTSKIGDSSRNTGLAGSVGGLNRNMLLAGGAAAGSVIAYKALETAFNSLYAPASRIAEEVEKQAQTLGLSTSKMQEWNFVATQNKASSEAVTKGFTELTKKSFEAYTGNSSAIESFKMLGISVTNNDGTLKSNNALIEETISKLAGIQNPSERAAVATELLGKAGKELLPMLSQGNEEIDKQRQAANKLGQVLSEDAITNLTKTGDAFDRLKTASAVAGGEFLNVFLPTIETGINLVTQFNAGVAKIFQGMSAEEKLTQTQEDLQAVSETIEEILKKQEQGQVIDKAALLYANQQYAALQEQRKVYQAMIDDKNKAANAKTPEVSAEAERAAQKAREEQLAKSAKARETAAKLAKAIQDKEAAEYIRLSESVNAAEQSAVNRRLQAQKAYESAKIALMADGVDKQKAILAQQLIDERNAIIKAALQTGRSEEQAWEDNKEALESVNAAYLKNVSKLESDQAKKDKADQKKLESDLTKIAIDGEKDEWKKKKALLELERKEAINNARETGASVDSVNALYTSKAIALTQQERDAKVSLAKDTARQQISNVTTMLETAAAKSKEAAIAYKALAISQTLVDTYKGAQSSYNALAGITIVGPVLGAAAAIAAVTAGLIRVNEIRKQQFASGGTSLGGLVMTGEMGPELGVLPAGTQVINHHRTQQIINNANRGGTNLYITVQGSGGRVSNQLVRELRTGSSDYLVKRLSKLMGVK